MDLPPPAPPAAAEAVAEAHDPVSDSLIAHVRASCPQVVQVRVTHLGLSERPPDDAVLSWSGNACVPSPSLRVEVVRDGLMVARWFARPHLDLWVRGPVAPRDVPAGTPFIVADGAVPWWEARGTPLTGRVVSTVSLVQGQPVTHRIARRVPDAAHRATVTLVLREGAVTIRAPGQLLRDAFIGEEVAVQNNATRVVQRGVLVDASTVVLNAKESR